MVQEYVSPVRVHKYPFEMVMAAYERRFPSCPQIPVVVECVITEDSWSSDDSQRDTTRKCQLNVEAPYLLKKMVGVDYIYFIQKNHLDLKNRFLEIEATNETFASRVGVNEKCKYYVHPENPDWTCFEQSALLDVKNFFGLENTVEKIAMKQYAANIAKGKELIESFMMEVHAEGVRELSPWSSTTPDLNQYLRQVVSRGTEPLSPQISLESRLHSQPGTSFRKSYQNLIKSSQNLGMSPRSSNRISKSNTRLSSSELKRTADRSSNLVKSSADISKGGANLSKRNLEKDHAYRKSEDVDYKSAALKKAFAEVPELKHRRSDPERRQDHVERRRPSPKLSRHSEDYMREAQEKIKTAFDSRPRQDHTVNEVLSRWDNLLIILILVMVIVLVLAVPLTFYLGRRRDSSTELVTRQEEEEVEIETRHQDQYTLDSEYIKKNLGELTPLQESRLLQLRKWIADLQKGKVPSETTLLRFLRARDFNVEKAREMLSQSLLWRKKHQVDRLLAEYETPDVVRQYFPGGWHHHDKDGRPLYVLRLGQMDVKGLLKSIGEDGLLKLTLHVCEEGLKLLEEASRSSEQPVLSWCMLVDLDGLNMRHLWRPGVRALLRIIQIVEANYPETMGRVLIVRAPRVFPILWTIVSTFIDENTRSKFLFYGGKDYLQAGGLLDYIPKDLIPDFLGGPCKSFVHEGGLVPKSLYVSGAFTEREGDPLCEDSIYRSVSIGKGQVHEVIVVNKDPQSVLTWDFDVLRHDIAFTVYRSDRELRLEPVDTNNALCVGAADEGSVLHQKGWREGDHFHRVEPTLACHDGESIQGSHVMVSSGSYVLQWRCEAMDSHRAAQLMYFYETLASHQYKGSMSSLQSGASGFSCLSGKSNISSCPSR